MTIPFRYIPGTKFTQTFAASFLTDFYNLKSKAAGARRIGYRVSVDRAENPEGAVAYRSDFKTTLDGAGYQSTKHSGWFATEGEARAAIDKTIAGASKRYTKLAADPVKNKIEHRPA
jgi:hypothetical protein